MDKMKLAKALKVKNRLVGDIQRVKNLINRENVKREDAVRKVDVNALLLTLNEKIKELVELKTALAKANVGIYEKIVKMEETKSLISYWENFQCQESSETDFGTGPNGTNVRIKCLPAIDQVKVDEFLSVLRKKAEDLQDEIDEYNGTTTI